MAEGSFFVLDHRIGDALDEEEVDRVCLAFGMVV